MQSPPSLLIDDVKGVLQVFGVVVQGQHNVVVGALTRIIFGNQAALHGGDLLQDESLELVAVLFSHSSQLLEFTAQGGVFLLPDETSALQRSPNFGLMFVYLLGDGQLALPAVNFLVLESILHAARILGHQTILILDVLYVLLAGQREFPFRRGHPVAESVNADLQLVEPVLEGGYQAVLDRRYLRLEGGLQGLVGLHASLDLRV
mmetsp:Transcript_8788/g.19313  ORF Transcript_8788/g.19313 Transcript_8788/m.19313 type:complete len:205 (-) Transcript_8788:220-834(-)|eukprot:CAMPEP_0170605680 /NCGR_PEP_ID=MMETSP0224-20130122/20102_1 /TAXON_ID=285029 /ORGANISM="Togula jolla, Strain CCCM 725" /LENGTH=204 /DNA_ID=CAMNT_0010930699 /DNA_START=108 /DNA_END=722 /DNA_ORIENTATION=-